MNTDVRKKKIASRGDSTERHHEAQHRGRIPFAAAGLRDRLAKSLNLDDLANVGEVWRRFAFTGVLPRHPFMDLCWCHTTPCLRTNGIDLDRREDKATRRDEVDNVRGESVNLLRYLMNM